MQHPEMLPWRQAVAANLRAAQTDAGLTSEQLARKLDVTLSTVQNWRCAKTLPTRYLDELCQTLHITPEWLFSHRADRELAA